MIFSKKTFAQAIRQSQVRENISDAQLINRTGYKERTFYEHMDHTKPNSPKPDQIARLAVETNTSLMLLLLGVGPSYFNYRHADESLTLLDLFNDEDNEYYGVLFTLIMSLPKDKVERLSDLVYFMLEKDLLK